MVFGTSGFSCERHEQIEGSLIQLLLLHSDLLLHLLLLYFTHTHTLARQHTSISVSSELMQAYEELVRKFDPFNSKLTIIQ